MRRRLQVSLVSIKESVEDRRCEDEQRTNGQIRRVKAQNSRHQTPRNTESSRVTCLSLVNRPTASREWFRAHCWQVKEERGLFRGVEFIEENKVAAFYRPPFYSFLLFVHQ